RYKICEVLNPSNCDEADATIVIEHLEIFPQIEKDLRKILVDELETTLIEQSSAMNTYASGALKRLQNKTTNCLNNVNERLQKDMIHFEFGKSTLNEKSHVIIDDIVKIFQDCEVSEFELAGHTDNIGSKEYNLDLSQRRVDAIVTAFESRGFDTENIVANGYGESKPLESNDTEQGRAINRRVEFIPLNNIVSEVDCYNYDFNHALQVDINDTNTDVNGSFEKEQYDCINKEWVITQGSVSYFNSDNGLLYNQFSLSYRREGFVNENSIQGWFIGAYKKKSSVTNLATGDISGFGVNAGVYRADKFDNGLYLDSYMGLAVGKHDFQLDFQRNIGNISTSGKYTYYAGFIGAAISGSVEYDEAKFSPRIGVDYIYSSSRNVNVTSKLNGIKQNNSTKLHSISGGRLFAELRGEREIYNGSANLALTPRISCYQSIGDSNSGCAVGASLELSTADNESLYNYSVIIDAEKGDDFTRGTVTGSVEYELSKGLFLNGNTSFSTDGDAVIGAGFELKY
ncbi:MAG: OmpA family protein, partial [Gammaproteobacteria bacterium]|nr:OmpA family protein [Gammaproteobacteria bacterium]